VFGDGQCVAYISSNDTYLLKPCNATSAATFCDPESTTNVTCTLAPPPLVSDNLFPGEICKTGDDCFYIKTCNADNRCAGLPVGATCIRHGVCNPGLRCDYNTNTCKQQIDTNDKGCQTDQDCNNGAGCNITTTGGVCIPYFSVDVGEVVSNCDEHYEISDFCETGWCLKTGFFSDTGLCITAPVSLNVPPHVCTTDSDCTGTTGQSTFSGSCQCGYNPEGAAYCSTFPGDPPGLAYIDALKYFITSGALEVCNTDRRFSEDCWKVSNGTSYYTMVAALQYFDNYPLYVDNSECIKQTYTRKYWDIYGSIGVATASLILMLS
jgi:hypothetical protein